MNTTSSKCLSQNTRHEKNVSLLFYFYYYTYRRIIHLSVHYDSWLINAIACVIVAEFYLSKKNKVFAIMIHLRKFLKYKFTESAIPFTLLGYYW